MSREVPLTRGYVAIVDDEDYERVAQHSWSAVPGRHTFYGQRTFWRPAERATGTMTMHAFVLGIKGVDHRDGNGPNNQRTNLRVASPTQNAYNRGKRTGTSSRFKGVHLHAGGRWVARITAAGVYHYLGLFDSESAAARAYDDAARGLFGEFARPNFPEGKRS